MGSWVYCCPHFNPVLKCTKTFCIYKISHSQSWIIRKLRMQLCTLGSLTAHNRSKDWAALILDRHLSHGYRKWGPRNRVDGADSNILCQKSCICVFRTKLSVNAWAGWWGMQAKLSKLESVWRKVWIRGEADSTHDCSSFTWEFKQEKTHKNIDDRPCVHY